MARKGKADTKGKKGRKGKKGAADDIAVAADGAALLPARRRTDPVARTSGTLVGMAVLGWTGFELLTGSIDLAGAAPRAGIAVVGMLLVEKLIVPVGRLIVGEPRRPADPEASQP